MGNKPPEFAPSDNPASDSESFVTRMFTYNYLPLLNFWMMLCPSVLSFDWSMEAVPLVESVSDMRNLLTLLFYGAFIYVLFKIAVTIENNDRGDFSKVKPIGKKYQKYGGKSFESAAADLPETCQHLTAHSNGSMNPSKHSKRNFSQLHSPISVLNGKSLNVMNSHADKSFISVSIRSVDVIILSIAMIVFPFIPASNLFFYVGFVIAERILYIPSMGVCLLVGLGVGTLYTRWQSVAGRRVLLLTLACLVLAFSARTMLRNLDWQSEERLYTSGIRVNPAKGRLILVPPFVYFSLTFFSL